MHHRAVNPKCIFRHKSFKKNMLQLFLRHREYISRKNKLFVEPLRQTAVLLRQRVVILSNEDSPRETTNPGQR